MNPDRSRLFVIVLVATLIVLAIAGFVALDLHPTVMERAKPGG